MNKRRSVVFDIRFYVADRLLTYQSSVDIYGGIFNMPKVGVGTLAARTKRLCAIESGSPIVTAYDLTV